MEAPKENFVKEIVKFTLVAIAIIIPIRLFVAQPFIVSGPSMDPTFASGQYLIVDQLTYHFNNPQREDVVIFRYPNNPSIFFIKRIIGLPGETVTIKGSHIYITNKEHPEGIEIDDSHVSTERKSQDDYSTTLHDTEYFVMGDNRRESSDSRMWGPVERKFIVGRPLLRLLPPTAISVFPGK